MRKNKQNTLLEHPKLSSLEKIIKLPFSFKEDTLALGAELKSTFCFARSDLAFLSKSLGDLEDLETLCHFQESIEDFKKNLRIKPKIIACDLHPEYLSTKFAHDCLLNYPDIKLIEVQHHHAHIASCMADNNMTNQKVIGVAFDGTGFGNDGNLWGGEFLIADYTDSKRAAFFDYVPLPGGTQAIKEPWRMAAVYLYKTYGTDFVKHGIDFVKRLDKQNWSILKDMIDKDINSPLSSSVGRLFDAVSSLIGIRDRIEYEGQAAIELEKEIGDTESGESYKYKINKNDGSFVIDSRPIIKEITEDLKKGLSKSKISAKFHNTIAKLILAISKRLREGTGISSVALSGGVFQNKYLYKKTIDYLDEHGFNVLTHRRISTSDVCICLGQAAVARYRGRR